MNIQNNILKNLYNNDINYFSFSKIKGNKVTISYCNNENWLTYYKRNFIDNSTLPPVYDYINLCNLKVLMWELIALDKRTQDYIKERNDIVGVQSNLTLLLKENEDLSILTFGSTKSKGELLDFTCKNTIFFYLIERAVQNLFRAS